MGILGQAREELGGNGALREEQALSEQIERAARRVPSRLFLSAALGSIVASALLQIIGRKHDAQFVGQWVPTVLLLGLYNRLRSE